MKNNYDNVAAMTECSWSSLCAPFGTAVVNRAARSVSARWASILAPRPGGLRAPLAEWVRYHFTALMSLQRWT